MTEEEERNVERAKAMFREEGSKGVQHHFSHRNVAYDPETGVTSMELLIRKGHADYGWKKFSFSLDKTEVVDV